MIPALRFDIAVPANGYAWWYVDALSDDGRYGLTIIAFIGSVFSPYYAWARRRGPTQPENHIALNVALYGPRRRWAMTERRSSSLRRDATTLGIGASELGWDGTSLRIEIDEIGAPLPRPIRGKIRITPVAMTPRTFAIDPGRRHHWWPIAPVARAEVRLDAPHLSWDGHAYLDTNAGEEPLEAGFSDWTWSRVDLPAGAAVFYDPSPRRGTGTPLSLRFDRHGGVDEIAPLTVASLPPTRIWRIPRKTRADANGQPRVHDTFEDTPFYARSMLTARVLGEETAAVHESLRLDRFAALPVQALLPFRMPRAFR